MTDSQVATDYSTDSLLRHSDDRSQTFFKQTSTSMPATALLRQLYTNRESVIRATSRQASYMHPHSHQQSFPTPPNDSYDSQFMRKPGEDLSNLVGYGIYHEYSNGMTPPSSVSPRDLTNHKHSGAYEYTNLPMNDSRVQCQPSDSTELNSLPHLPLKPQPFTIHQMDSNYSIDPQSQYFQYHQSFHLYHKSVYNSP